MALTTFLILLAAFLVYVLLMPLELCIDSGQEKYYLRMGLLARVSVEQDPVEFLKLHLKVLFFDFSWRPSEMRSWGSRRKKSPEKRVVKVGKRRKMTPGRVIKLLKSFRVKTLRLDLDTGNPILNAQLIPFFYLLGQGGGELGINFEGRSDISLKITNRPINILNAFINPKK